MEGKTNINSKPVIRYDGQKVDGIFGVMDKWHSLIMGINSGGGSGSENFSVYVNIFVDDFPKIKAKYEKFLVLNGAAIKAASVHKGLVVRAQKEVIDQDKELIALEKQREILIDFDKHNNALRTKRIQSILNTFGYKDIIKIPQEYEYDRSEYDRLKPEFSK